MKEKLDRYLANEFWLDKFSKASAINCGFYGSNHRAVKIMLNHSKWVPKVVKNKKFIFENKWLLEDNFVAEAKKCWEQAGNSNNLPVKLRECSIRLQEWATTEAGNSKKKIQKVMKEIEEIQDKDSITGEEEVLCSKEKELEKLLFQEDLYWQQRAKK